MMEATFASELAPSVRILRCGKNCELLTNFGGAIKANK
jgi:hypothetical protein